MAGAEVQCSALVLLTCVLCTAAPALPDGVRDHLSLAADRLVLSEEAPVGPSAPVPLALGEMPDHGSGEGDHSDRMGPMLILMGTMMVVMMVGMGANFMRHHSTAAQPIGPARLLRRRSRSR